MAYVTPATLTAHTNADITFNFLANYQPKNGQSRDRHVLSAEPKTFSAGSAVQPFRALNMRRSADYPDTPAISLYTEPVKDELREELLAYSSSLARSLETYNASQTQAKKKIKARFGPVSEECRVSFKVYSKCVIIEHRQVAPEQFAQFKLSREELAAKIESHACEVFLWFPKIGYAGIFATNQRINLVAEEIELFFGPKKQRKLPEGFDASAMPVCGEEESIPPAGGPSVTDPYAVCSTAPSQVVVGDEPSPYDSDA